MLRDLWDAIFFQIQFKNTIAKSNIWRALDKPEVHLKNIPYKALSSLFNELADDALKATKQIIQNTKGNFRIELNNQCIYRAKYLMDIIQSTNTQTPTPEMKAILEKYRPQIKSA